MGSRVSTSGFDGSAPASDISGQAIVDGSNKQPPMTDSKSQTIMWVLLVILVALVACCYGCGVFSCQPQTPLYTGGPKIGAGEDDFDITQYITQA